MVPLFCLLVPFRPELFLYLSSLPPAGLSFVRLRLSLCFVLWETLPRNPFTTQVLPFSLLWFVVGASGERGGLQGQTLVPCEVECTHRGVGREKEFQEKQFCGNLAGWGGRALA